MKTPGSLFRSLPKSWPPGAFLLVTIVTPGLADEAPALPDPIMTPGAVDPAVDWNAVCNGTTRRRRAVPTSRCEAVFRAYSIPPGDRYQYECDHDIPLAQGGSNVAANLWPQPNVEAARKGRLEVEMQRLVCRSQIALPQAQREIADDWAVAYDRYVLHTLPPSSSAASGKTLTRRLGAVVRRLSRSWMRELD